MSWAAFVIFSAAYIYQVVLEQDTTMSVYGIMFIVANFCFNKTAQLIKGVKNA